MKQNQNPFGEEMRAALREEILRELSPKRFRHTVAVEEMVARLAELYCPDQSDALRVAALLHDVTKEWSVERHCAFCEAHGIALTEQDRVAHKTLHARTAAALIPEKFPQCNNQTVVSAVRWHTTGHAGMTLPEKLLYLADYIDLSRKFKDCVILRRYFWGAEPESMNPAERAALLRETLILSYDMTIASLTADGLPIAEDTTRARNELILERFAAEAANA